MTSENDSAQIQLDKFLKANDDDLKKIGLLFLRILAADFCTISPHPSATLLSYLTLEQRHLLGTKKQLIDLFNDMSAANIPVLTDECGRSVLRIQLQPGF